MDENNKNIEEINQAIDCVSKIRDIITSDGCNDIMCDVDKAGKLIERIEDSERNEFISHTLKSKNQERDIERLKIHLNTLKNKKRKVRMRRLTILVTTTAASLMTFFIVLFHNNGNDNRLKDKEISAELKPTLKNESGELIVLDNIDKIIETASYSINKYDETKLEYVARDSSKDEILHLTVPAGYTYTVKLSDATEITLNGGSELSYPTRFNKNVRQVEFSGEAFFKVTKSEQPFIVNSKGLYVKVYGTEFNINTQQKDKFETVLINGSIGVGVIGGGDIKIRPNQMYEYNFDTGTSTIYEVEADDYISWLDNSFCYQNRPAEAIIADISVWYGVEFTMRKDISDLNLTFNIDRSTKIDDLLLFIESLTDIKFIKEKKGGYTIE